MNDATSQADAMTELTVSEQEFVQALAVGDAARAERLGVAIERADQHPPMPALGSAALWYASCGIPVFPLRPLRKRPLPKTNGFKDATADLAVVRRMWELHPTSNIGVPTGLFFDAVDIDGPVGQQSRTLHFEAFESLQVLASVLTPRPGGLHIWVPPVPDQGNRAKMLPGIDYRGKGGYVVAPPSVLEELPATHDDGPQTAGVYRFLRPPIMREVPQ